MCTVGFRGSLGWRFSLFTAPVLQLKCSGNDHVLRQWSCQSIVLHMPSMYRTKAYPLSGVAHSSRASRAFRQVRQRAPTALRNRLASSLVVADLSRGDFGVPGPRSRKHDTDDGATLTGTILMMLLVVGCCCWWWWCRWWYR